MKKELLDEYIAVIPLEGYGVMSNIFTKEFLLKSGDDINFHEKFHYIPLRELPEFVKTLKNKPDFLVDENDEKEVYDFLKENKLFFYNY